MSDKITFVIIPEEIIEKKIFGISISKAVDSTRARKIHMVPPATNRNLTVSETSNSDKDEIKKNFQFKK